MNFKQMLEKAKAEGRAHVITQEEWERLTPAIRFAEIIPMEGEDKERTARFEARLSVHGWNVEGRSR